MLSNLSDHERFELLLSVLGCNESDPVFRAAYKIWTSYRRLTIADAVRIGEGLVTYSPGNDLFAGFCAANYARYLTVRHYTIVDVIFTHSASNVGWIFCYLDSPLNVECHQVTLLNYNNIKHSNYGNYFYQD